jgi:hypothetical protein
LKDVIEGDVFDYVDTADADLQVQINEVFNAIPKEVNRFLWNENFPSLIEGTQYLLMKGEASTRPIQNVGFTTAVTVPLESSAHLLVRGFVREDALLAPIDFQNQITSVYVQACKGGANPDIFLYAVINKVNADLTIGDEVGRSAPTPLTETPTIYKMDIAITQFLAEEGTRGLVRFYAYRVGNPSTSIINLCVEDDTASRWTYNTQASNVSLLADNVKYNGGNVKEALRRTQRETR